jgi:aromatic ring-opening dioxygenase catalytic subunit (LigB family)
MAEIVSIHAVSHTPVMINFPQAVSPDARDQVYQAFKHFGQQVMQAQPDVLLLLSDDHVHNFFLNNMPAFCIGAAGNYQAPVEHWLKVDKRVLPGDSVLGSYLLEQALQNDFDPALSMELVLDHGFITPLELSGISSTIPIVPLLINCVQPPLPKMGRCYAFGEMIAKALLAHGSNQRVSVIASGGISHDLSTPRMGMINEAFDRQFIDHLCQGQAQQAIDFATQHVHLAGNGAEEIRMWLMAMGMSKALTDASLVKHPVNGHAPFELDFYQALHDWFTGIGLGHWKIGSHP